MALHTEARDLATPEFHRMFGLRRRRPRAAATTEFGAALTAFGIKHRSAARWFRTSERNIRRWKSGTRKTTPGVAVVVRLMMAGKVTVADVELATGLVAPRTNGGVEPEPSAPVLVEPEPEPEQSAGARAEVAAFVGLSPAAAAVVALDDANCRWPCGDPGHPDFHFCCDPVGEKPPYCERHHSKAYLVAHEHRPRAQPALTRGQKSSNLSHLIAFDRRHERHRTPFKPTSNAPC
jgi:hypothetical protein